MTTALGLWWRVGADGGSATLVLGLGVWGWDELLPKPEVSYVIGR